MAADAERVELARAHFERAEGRLRVARRLLEMGEPDDAVSRAYYAAYHAVTAALAAQGLEAKTHDGAPALFALHFVRPGLVTREVGRAVQALHRQRQTGDYDAFPLLTDEDAHEAVERAAAVVETVRGLLPSPPPDGTR